MLSSVDLQDMDDIQISLLLIASEGQRGPQWISEPTRSARRDLLISEIPIVFSQANVAYTTVACFLTTDPTAALLESRLYL
jgi:hypothetical protein